MSYFPHAFQKMLVATAATSPFPAGNGTLNTLDLTAGQVGVVDAKTNLLINTGAAASYPTTPLIYLAQGSFRANDKLGPYHGGYQETVKSKGINPKYVSKFYKTLPAPATQHILDVVADGCALECDKTFRLRLDVKGSPALRFLTHNLYKTLDAYTGCCDVAGTPNDVDPNVVLLQWRDQISGNALLEKSPILGDFINAKVHNLVDTVAAATTATSAVIDIANADVTEFVAGRRVKIAEFPATATIVTVGAADSAGAGFTEITLSDVATATTAVSSIEVYEEIITNTISGGVVVQSYVPVTGGAIANVKSFLELTGAYVDSTYSTCTFNPKNHFELQPIQIYASFVEESGDHCAAICFESVEVQEAYQGKGYGETLVRELILAKRYQQEDWNENVLLRERLGDTSLAEIDKDASDYVVYHILHSVPRKANPSGMFDNDQYLVKIVAKASDTAFETYMNGLLTSANNAVQLETLA